MRASPRRQGPKIMPRTFRKKFQDDGKAIMDGDIIPFSRCMLDTSGNKIVHICYYWCGDWLTLCTTDRDLNYPIPVGTERKATCIECVSVEQKEVTPC